MAFKVIVARVGESAHEPGEFTVEGVEAVAVGENGRLNLTLGDGRVHDYANTSWGAFKVVRVESAAKRI